MCNSCASIGQFDGKKPEIWGARGEKGPFYITVTVSHLSSILPPGANDLAERMELDKRTKP